MQSGRQALCYGMTDAEVVEYLHRKGASGGDEFLVAVAAKILLRDALDGPKPP